MDSITVIGSTFVLFYCAVQIFTFYNIPANLYIIYLIFYVFMVLTYLFIGKQ
uniref:Uncharacterized protein n=1 Tax=viral metagenome TaxID=1070528 RepID=A0A6C0E3X2_9ZZZZ